MSKQKRIERFKKEGPFRQGTTPTAPRFRCPFPGCDWTFTKEEKKLDACDKHRQFVQDFFFVQENVHKIPPPGSRLDQAVKDGKGVILIPKPGMSAQAIKEAVEAAKTKGA